MVAVPNSSLLDFARSAMAATSTKRTAKATAQSNSSSKKNATSGIGAPSQRAQASRKGKRAWRKNIDIDPVEEGLEEIRAEERVVGCVPLYHVLLNHELTCAVSGLRCRRKPTTSSSR